MLKNLIFTVRGPFRSTSYTQPVPAYTAYKSIVEPFVYVRTTSPTSRTAYCGYTTFAAVVVGGAVVAAVVVDGAVVDAVVGGAERGGAVVGVADAVDGAGVGAGAADVCGDAEGATGS